MLYSRFELTDTVVCGSGTHAEMSSSVNQGNEVFPFSNEGSRNITERG